MKNRIELKPIMISLGIIILASLTYALGTSMIFVLPFGDMNSTYLVSLMTFMPVGFIVLPFILSREQLKEADITFNWKQYIILAAIIFIINHFFIRSNEYYHQMMISMCEEVLFRYIIYGLLRKHYKYGMAILITSILFGFILHLDYPLIDNLLIRMPLGIIFSILATKFGLQYAIAGHWLFNLLASKSLF